jgi:PST family polysaccharide transporter
LKPFDKNSTLRLPKDAIRNLAVRGAGITVFSNGLGLVVQTASTVVLARLLAPADFGLVTMVTTFSLLFVNFGLNGFTEAVIQWKEIDHQRASNLFWINLAVGGFLTLGFAKSGSLLAWFYHDPVVARIAAGISWTILVTSFSVVHLALLKRAMQFSVVATNDIVARTISLALAILLAWHGWGYWALVAAAVALSLCTTIGAWYLCPWLPGLPARLPGTAALVGFAVNVYGRFSVNYFSRNADNLLVGWRFEPRALGFYKKAYDLFSLSASQLISPLSNVALSALSRLDRNSVEYRQYLLNALAVIAFVGMGVAAELTLVGRDVIRLLLGPGWDEAGHIFTFFGPGVGVMFLYYTHGWIHLSIGRADRWFRWGIFEFVFTVTLFVLALPWGPAGIALAWTASFWILLIPAFWYAGRPIEFGVARIISVAWKFALASALAGVASAVILRRISHDITPTSLGLLIQIVRASLLCGSLYLIGVVLLHRGGAPIHQFTGLVRDSLPSGIFSRPRVAAARVNRYTSYFGKKLTSFNPTGTP